MIVMRPTASTESATGGGDDLGARPGLRRRPTGPGAGRADRRGARRDAKSVDVRRLLPEVEMAPGAADDAAMEARARALDPPLPRDDVKVARLETEDATSGWIACTKLERSSPNGSRPRNRWKQIAGCGRSTNAFWPNGTRRDGAHGGTDCEDRSHGQ